MKNTKMCFRFKIVKIVYICTKTSQLSILLFAATFLLLQQQQSQHVLAGNIDSTRGSIDSGSIAKGLLPRIRSVKIASIHGLQAAVESLPFPAKKNTTITKTSATTKDKMSLTAVNSANAAATNVAGKYEIRTVSGEPNYKSVNLTWEVEFVPSTENVDAVTNSSAEVEPPKAFQIFFCELQSFGPQRCRSKLVNESQHVEMTANYNKHNNMPVVEENNRQVRHYTAPIENLRMATKYSFHIRPQQKRRNMKITGRSEIFGNEIEDASNPVNNFEGQTIIIPTKGFSAQATKCLPHASEIEVDTGPYFGGKIVVDGGNCGVKGNTEDSTEKYTMRIDHKMCGSLVKPETNTVETFITVQENLGIFTHSTRRFVVVCSFQSGMQTVRASFTVPGKDGVAAPVQNDPFEADDRMSREQRHMRYVDKSSLVLKENYDDLSDMELQNYNYAEMESDNKNMVSGENEAIVEEVQDNELNVTTEQQKQQQELLSNDSTDDVENSVAVLEDIIPGVNEEHIKHENEVVEHAKRKEPTNHSVPIAHARLAEYAKLMGERNIVKTAADQEWLNLSDAGVDGRVYASSLHYISSNIGSIVATVSLTVIIIGIFIFIVYREAHRQRFIKEHTRQHQQKTQQQQQHHNHLQHKTIPRSLQPKL